MQTRTPLDDLPAGQRMRLARLPRSLVILLENVLAYEPKPETLVAHFESWLADGHCEAELPFRPTRILMQDTAGVAALADLAALRDFAAENGHPPEAVDAEIPIDLVIDHSIRVDFSGQPDAAVRNLALEYERNGERYRFFKWAEQAFARLRVVPPGQGICHQVNLEQLTRGAVPVPGGKGLVMAETLIGTDSHTTMVNALGVLGWGVGGIEAELAALRAPLPVPMPRVVSVRLIGRRSPAVTATDIALAVTAELRAKGVVDCIVEFHGPGLDALTLPDRAAIANMCPEYGATAALFPVDEVTLGYLTTFGRTPAEVLAYRNYAKVTGLWRDDEDERTYSCRLTLSLDGIAPVMAGPSRPQQIHLLSRVAESLREAFPDVRVPTGRGALGNGAIAIAAITSCTNTANPHLMIAAGLLARNAVRLGLRVPTWVKTSLAPGSRRIAALLKQAGLQAPLDELGFSVVGFGCTTCVGNSGELKGEMQGTGAPNLMVAVLSGNRNFESRIHPAIKANYLASPPLVIAAALAGNLFIDLENDPLGFTPEGAPVFLVDIWPSDAELASAIASARSVQSEEGACSASEWRELAAQVGARFAWDPASTFIRRPPFLAHRAGPLDSDIEGARVLLSLGDNVTTDHISPIGRIAPDSLAGGLLRSAGESEAALGGYGDRRANHDVMLRGTFDNIRLENRLADRSGNRTPGPDGTILPVFEAAEAYAALGTQLVIFAGERYGTGSARDWAAKGTALLGVRAVIARSFERIHRANLVALGVLPIICDVGLKPPAAIDVIAVRGIADLSAGSRDLVVEVERGESGEVEHYPALADVWSESQLALLRGGGIFSRLRERFGR